MLPNIPDEGTETLFFDNGAAWLWRDMIANSPCLNVRDFKPGNDAARERADALTPEPSLSFHDHPNRGEEQRDNA